MVLASGESGNGGGGGAVQNLLLPAAGLLTVAVLGGPLIGGATVSLGLALLMVGGAALTGVLDRIAAVFGVTPVEAAGMVAVGTVGVLLVPFLFKFALAGAAIAAVFSFLASQTKFSTEESIDAKDAIIDVDVTTIDD